MNTVSSSVPSAFTSTSPRRLKAWAAEPDPPRAKPRLLNTWRTSEAVRFRLSVRHSTRIPTPAGP